MRMIEGRADQTDHVALYRRDLLSALQSVLNTIGEVLRVELRSHLGITFMPQLGCVAFCPGGLKILNTNLL